MNHQDKEPPLTPPVDGTADAAGGEVETPKDISKEETADDDPPLETPKRRKGKTSPKPPAAKKPRARNLRFDAIAKFGWNIQPGGTYGDATSARVGKVLKELDQTFPDPKLTYMDIVNAYMLNREQEKIPPRDPVAVVSMVSTWIKAGRKDYSDFIRDQIRMREAERQPFTPSPIPDPPQPRIG